MKGNTQMHPDFKRTATLRKFMMRGDAKIAPNFGRDIAAKWIGQHGAPLPPQIKIDVLPHNTGRVFTPAQAATDQTLIYIHGGGLVYYDTAVFTPFLTQLSAALGVKIIALDYPKAPETDAQDIFSTLADRVRQILADTPNTRFSIAGDSVGGLLALKLCQTLTSVQFENLHLIYPVVDRTTAPNSPFGREHFLDTSMMTWFYKLIDPLFEQFGSPCEMSPKDLCALPPTTLHIAEADILAAQGQSFGAILSKANRLQNYETHVGLPHDFCLYAGSSDAAKSAIQLIAENMKGLIDA